MTEKTSEVRVPTKKMDATGRLVRGRSKVKKHPGLKRCLYISADQHSVGFSASYFMKFFLLLRVAFMWDESHRVTNDVLGGIKRAGGNWWCCMALMAIPFVVNYGPWDGGAWWAKAKGAFKKMLKGVGRSTCLQPLRGEVNRIMVQQTQERFLM